MLAFERQQRIIELLHEYGAVSVSKLSSEFGVAEETVRRDLEKLEKQEKLLRTHGGAVPVDDNKHEPSIDKRKKLNVEEKQSVARAAAELVVPGDTIFLDASTTTFFLARELKGMKNITVITNSLQTMQELSGIDGIKLIGTGGIVGANLSFVGSLEENAVREKYFANKMFFSSRGVTVQAGILDSNEQECAMKKCMLENAQQKIYVCEHSKIDRIGFAKLASFEEIDAFVTDLPLGEEWHKRLDEANTEIIESK